MSYFNDGNKYYNNKDYSKALENYIESIDIGENESCAYYNAGVCYIKLKDFNSAIDMLKKALYIQKESKYYFNLAYCYAMLVVSKADIVDTFNNICNYSVYNRQNEIVNGFVTMYGGHRAGICGTAVVNNGKIVNIRDITSINVRIAREHKGCADSLYNKIIAVSGGVLICGAPCSGKTTVLRDLARLLSTKGKKNVALIDERGELAGTASGKFQNDIGMCDVYDSYNKSEAMLHAIRSMAPEIVICDEIGSKEDIYAVEKSVNCGVRIISSTHCANEYELKQKANMVSLMKTGAFQTLVFLSNRTHAGEIVKISQVGDNFAV